MLMISWRLKEGLSKTFEMLLQENILSVVGPGLSLRHSSWIGLIKRYDLEKVLSSREVEVIADALSKEQLC